MWLGFGMFHRNDRNARQKQDKVIKKRIKCLNSHL